MQLFRFMAESIGLGFVEISNIFATQGDVFSLLTVEFSGSTVIPRGRSLPGTEKTGEITNKEIMRMNDESYILLAVICMEISCNVTECYASSGTT